MIRTWAEWLQIKIGKDYFETFSTLKPCIISFLEVIQLVCELFDHPSYITIFNFMNIDSGYLPVSPYTMQFWVLDLRLRINFRNFKCTFSIMSKFSYSQTLQE